MFFAFFAAAAAAAVFRSMEPAHLLSVSIIKSRSCSEFRMRLSCSSSSSDMRPSSRMIMRFFLKVAIVESNSFSKSKSFCSIWAEDEPDPVDSVISGTFRRLAESKTFKVKCLLDLLICPIF